jgi:hypothetical protein
MPVPDFSPGEVLTAAAMDSIGLWKVAAGSLSLTTTPTNVTGVFDNSKYKRYRVLLACTARSTTNRFDMKFINGTTPTSSAYYSSGLASDTASNTTVYFQRSNNDTQIYLDTVAGVGSYVFDVFNANAAAATLFQGSVVSVAANYSWGGIQNSSTTFTGFQLFTSTGTATVEYQVFGYRD